MTPKIVDHFDIEWSARRSHPYVCPHCGHRMDDDKWYGAGEIIVKSPSFPGKFCGKWMLVLVSRCPSCQELTWTHEVDTLPLNILASIYNGEGIHHPSWVDAIEKACPGEEIVRWIKKIRDGRTGPKMSLM